MLQVAAYPRGCQQGGGRGAGFQRAAAQGHRTAPSTGAGALPGLACSGLCTSPGPSLARGMSLSLLNRAGLFLSPACSYKPPSLDVDGVPGHPTLCLPSACPEGSACKPRQRQPNGSDRHAMAAAAGREAIARAASCVPAHALAVLLAGRHHAGRLLEVSLYAKQLHAGALLHAEPSTHRAGQDSGALMHCSRRGPSLPHDACTTYAGRPACLLSITRAGVAEPACSSSSRPRRGRAGVQPHPSRLACRHSSWHGSLLQAGAWPGRTLCMHLQKPAVWTTP